MGIFEVNEVSIESSSSGTSAIRSPQNLRNGKKNLRRFVLKIKKENPSSDVEVWSMDEHRRLIETCERGENGWMSLVMPLLLLTGGFNSYGYTAKVHPSTGETYWWILPFVNSQLFERVLEDFALQ
jgi:hypothetical protein